MFSDKTNIATQIAKGVGISFYSGDENKMSKSKIGPEAKIITLFAALPEDSRRIVLDVLKSQSAPTPRKAAKKPAASQAEPKADASEKEPKCGICGNPPDHADHDRTYLSSHEFEGPKLVARAPRKSRQKSEAANSTPNSEIGTDAVIAASSGGD